MRLVTRSDFDGLACGTILCKKGVVDDFLFVHPKNIQDNEVDITADDILTNVPYHPKAGMWFDHHCSEIERVTPETDFLGKCDTEALSCARLVYDYYKGSKNFPELAEMIDNVDKVDAALLTIEEVLYPKDWVLLGFLCDPRTGLGRWHSFEISNRDLMKYLMIDLCSTGDIARIMADKHVKARVDCYNEQQALYDKMVRECSRFEDGVLITDLRKQSVIYTGNRFKPYAMYPYAKVSVTIINGKGNKGSVVAIGKSIFNDFNCNIGSLCFKYNGGGHSKVGTCQFADTEAPEIDDIIKYLKERC